MLIIDQFTGGKLYWLIFEATSHNTGRAEGEHSTCTAHKLGDAELIDTFCVNDTAFCWRARVVSIRRLGAYLPICFSKILLCYSRSLR